MSVEDCFKAVEESGAPTVSICGGEPTIYPELPELLLGVLTCQEDIALDRLVLVARGNQHPVHRDARSLLSFVFGEARSRRELNLPVNFH